MPFWVERRKNEVMSIAEHWSDIGDVSTHLKVNKKTISRWINKREFPSHRAGNLLRFKLSEVDDWVRRGSEERPVQEEIDND